MLECKAMRREVLRWTKSSISAKISVGWPMTRAAPPHDWSAFYAAYIVARERGGTPEQADAEARRHMDAVLG